MASFVTRAVSFIASLSRKIRSRLASSRASTGSHSTSSERDLWRALLNPNHPEANAAWESLASMPKPSRACGASLPNCPQHKYHSPYHGGHTVACALSEGHPLPHISGNLQGLGISKRFTEHGVTHDVAWFSVMGQKRRMIDTRCGLHFETHNRTRNNKPITCVRCACRSY